jgi:hypothetical protein
MPSVSFSKRLKRTDWASRKLWFSVFAVFMLWLGLHAAVDSTAFAAVYGTFAGSVVAICGLFLTGNVIAGKLAASTGPVPPATPETSPKPEETPG